MKNKMEKQVIITIKEIELDGETAIKIAKCIKTLEPELWEEISVSLKNALSDEFKNQLDEK